jgi:hypothetical protein
MPGRDTPREEAHDVLAAEAFAVPAPDPSLRQHPIELPDDPSGIEGPHDVLAAEEFAMPATCRPREPGGSGGLAARAPAPVRVGALAALALQARRLLTRRRPA